MFKALIAFCLSRRAIVVFGLLLFLGAGYVAFRRLNIEAYPNPTPVILEITAQAPGLSAEEMERYYTRPIEIGLYTTPGIDIIRSISFYGLSFVRVVFKYGVDFHFAYGQAAIALQQNVSLPGGLVPTILQSSTTGEIYRYQVVGPKHFGVTNLRTVQDWIVRRRLLTIPGIVAVNSWGGPTKEFQVQVDSHSASPAFAEDNRQVAIALARAGAIDAEDLIHMLHPPGAELLLARLRQRQKRQAQAAQAEEKKEMLRDVLQLPSRKQGGAGRRKR